MEKLKIYSAYLPYKLKVKTNCGQIRELAMVDAESNCIAATETNGMIHIDSAHIKGNGFKLILFSLENLTKEITINGETFVPFDELIKIKNVRLRVEKYENGDKKLLNINTFSFSLFDFEYKIIEKLLEWKFNVFNLPEIEYIKVTEENNPYK